MVPRKKKHWTSPFWALQLHLAKRKTAANVCIVSTEAWLVVIKIVRKSFSGTWNKKVGNHCYSAYKLINLSALLEIEKVGNHCCRYTAQFLTNYVSNVNNVKNSCDLFWLLNTCFCRRLHGLNTTKTLVLVHFLYFQALLS